MSSRLLFGIAVVGVGWVALGRSRAATGAAASLKTGDTQGPGVAAPDVGETQNNLAGTSSLAGAVACGTAGAANVGGSPVEGVSNLNSSGNPQTIQVSFAPEGGMAVLDGTQSTGGPDPSTQSTSVGSSVGVHRLGLGTPLSQTENTGASGVQSDKNAEGSIYLAAYGPAGRDGVTTDAAVRKYMQIGKMTGEVW